MTHVSSSTSRQEVYEAIDSEREYQDLKWNVGTTISGGFHEPAAFLLFMEEYLEEARKGISRNPDPEATKLALDSIRKVVALGIACMEQHGAPKRNLATVQYQNEMKARAARYAEVKEKSKRK